MSGPIYPLPQKGNSYYGCGNTRFGITPPLGKHPGDGMAMAMAMAMATVMGLLK